MPPCISVSGFSCPNGFGQDFNTKYKLLGTVLADGTPAYGMITAGPSGAQYIFKDYGCGMCYDGKGALYPDQTGCGNNITGAQHAHLDPTFVSS